MSKAAETNNHAPLTIVHVTEAWAGGIATYVNTLLLDQARQNRVILIYSYHLNTRDFDPEMLQKNGITCIPYTSSRNPIKFIKISRRIHRILKEFDPDIVHLHSSFAGAYGRILSLPGKIIYCPHGWPFVQEKGFFKRAIYTCVEWLLARRSDAIINISNHEYIEAQKRFIEAKENVAIPSGLPDINNKKISPVSLNINAPDAIHLGYIGRLDYKKGIDLVIAVIQKLDHKIANIHLHIIGDLIRDGHGSEKIDHPRIHYHGWIDNKNIANYINAFDALIVPSRQEGFGLVAVEALRSSRPAIVSNAGGLPEIIEHTKNGYIFDLNASESLNTLLLSLDKKTLKNMRVKARQRYEELYTDKRFCNDIMELYQIVAAK